MLHLAHKVSTHISCLGVDAPAQLGKQSHKAAQAGYEGQHCFEGPSSPVEQQGYSRVQTQCETDWHLDGETQQNCSRIQAEEVQGSSISCGVFGSPTHHQRQYQVASSADRHTISVTMPRTRQQAASQRRTTCGSKH